MDNQDALARQVDLLSRTYPGRLALSLKEACLALGIKPKTYHYRASRGDYAMPTRRQGGRLVVLLEDVARAALELPPIDAVPPAAPAVEQLASRRGRPSNIEKLEAARAGVTVAELRARRAGEEARR